MNQQDKERLRELAQEVCDSEGGSQAWRRWYLHAEGLPDAILALLDENERLAKDAARYAWVRIAGAWDSEIGLNSKTPDQYDTEVDWNLAQSAMQHKGD